MAENNNASSTVDNLREELSARFAQLEDLLKSVNSKGQDATSDLAARIAQELENCRHKAAQRAGQLRDYGQAGMEEVGEHVRQNPLASIAIAFGAGYLLSCLFRRLR